jgi:hypothetical protein
MGKKMTLENFDVRLAGANELIAENKLRILHIQNVILGGGVTIVYRRLFGNSFIEFSTAICSKNDQYNKKIGRILATESFERGEIVRIPSYDHNPTLVLTRMFETLMYKIF